MLGAEEVIDSPREMVRAHLLRYLATDGDEGFIWKGAPTLLLTTRGRKSQLLRRTALIFGRHNDDYLVVGSRGGAPQHPLWFENLFVDSKVTVQVKGSIFPAVARSATASERPELWQIMAKIWPAYDEYQKKTERQIPIVVLSATKDAAPAFQSQIS